MKIILAVIVSLVFANDLQSQIIPEWTTSYGVNYPNTITQNDMVIDKNGNVYTTGYKIDTSTYYYTLVTLKYNSSGILQWAQSFDSLSYYSRIAVDDSGNVFISAHWDNLLTIKYNTNGVLLWAKSYPGGIVGNKWAFDIKTDNLSNVYMIGIANGNRITTLKYNPSGVLQWAAIDSTVNGLSTSYFISLDNNNENVYITGRADTIGYASVCKTIKYNTAGMKLWERFYKSNFNPGLSYPKDLKYDPLGFIYLLVATTNNNQGDGDYVVVKYDTLGNQLWTLSKSFTTYYDVPKSMAIDKTGNVYVTGIIWPTGGTIDSLATIKISKSGVLKWTRTYSSGFWNDDDPSEIAIDSLGYVYVAGKSSDSYNLENFLTIKYDSLGNQKWLGRYKNSFYSSDEANSIKIDKFGNIYVSGTTFEANSSGILTIKYSNTVGIDELSNNSVSSLNIYPNPSSNTLYFVAEQPNFEKGNIEIINSLGQTVLKSEFKNQIDVSELASGFYTLLIKDDSGSFITKKFVKE